MFFRKEVILWLIVAAAVVLGGVVPYVAGVWLGVAFGDFGLGTGCN